MNEKRVRQIFDQLPNKRKQVLLKLLAGESRAKIAGELCNGSESAVQQHLRQLFKDFNIQGIRERKTPELIALLARSMSELFRASPLGKAPAVTSATDLQTLSSNKKGLSPTELPIEDCSFLGRNSAIADLDALASQGATLILIHARGGIGKTTLARRYLQQRFDTYLEFPIAKETQNITTVESLLEERLRQLGEEPGREFGVSLDRLKRRLQRTPLGLLIDNLEPALDNGKLIQPHRRYLELLRVLADPSLPSLTLITSRERLHEAAIPVRHYSLPGLDITAWHTFFQAHNIDETQNPAPLKNKSPQIPENSLSSASSAPPASPTPSLTALHNAYGGNAKAMELLSSAIQQDYNGDLDAYWQANRDDLLLNRDLEDLVVTQFNRLQQLDTNAYTLLCRLGCYRYQDVPTVPLEGLLCLLWEVSERQQRRAIEALRDRALLELSHGEYFLHPSIRAEAIHRLRKREDWEQTNHIAAEFWTESVKTVETIKNVLKALEAYYHYLEINAFDLAGKVIINRRGNDSWRNESVLGAECWRLGLLRQITSAIIRIEDRVSDDYCLCELAAILGYIYNLVGNIHKANDYHLKSEKISIRLQDLVVQGKKKNIPLSRLKSIRAATLINRGLCQIDLWEIKKAIEIFDSCSSVFQNIDQNPYATIACWFCLAFLNSSLGFNEKAYSLAEVACNNFSTADWEPWTYGYGFLFLGLTYRNLEQIDKSFEMFHNALSFAEETHYIQLKAVSLSGLAQLYRKQWDFKRAFSHHEEAILLLDRIGAKCDLAEATYQLALTEQAMGERAKSRINFEKAIQWFSEMEAPKQVEKVRNSIQD